MDRLKQLIELIQETSSGRGSWKISRDEVLEALNLDIRDVYSRIVLSQNPLVDYATSEFTERDAGALISLLECLGFEEAPEQFNRSGLWVPYATQVDLLSALIDEVNVVREKHIIDYEGFLSIFDHFRNFHRSLEIYLDENFPTAEIIEKAVDSVRNSNNYALLKKLAEELIRREILPYWNLFTPLFEKLKTFLIAKGRLDAPGRKEAPINEAEREARQLFSYSIEENITKKDLKSRYKNLMKRFHPDINPKGLEQSKEINTAYSTLLARIA